MIKKIIGTVTICGKPNVGKSTLINSIMKDKIAIISGKPQTTRNQIRAIYNDDTCQLVFNDTPGYHEPKNKLDLFLNSEVKRSFKVADVILFLSDITRPVDKEDEEVLKKLKAFNSDQVILVITKAETSEQEIIDERIASLKKQYNFVNTIQISGKHSINIEKLINTIKIYLTTGPLLYDENTMHELTDSFVISEIIRENCINFLRQEVPYALAVQIESEAFDATKNIYNIDATIVVEKESQKPIVIGKAGSMVKKIGVASRAALLDIYDCRINLKIFVKVEDKWRDSDYLIKSLGYKK